MFYVVVGKLTLYMKVHKKCYKSWEGFLDWAEWFLHIAEFVFIPSKLCGLGLKIFSGPAVSIQKFRMAFLSKICLGKALFISIFRPGLEIYNTDWPTKFEIDVHWETRGISKIVRYHLSEPVVEASQESMVSIFDDFIVVKPGSEITKLFQICVMHRQTSINWLGIRIRNVNFKIQDLGMKFLDSRIGIEMRNVGILELDSRSGF